MNRTGLGIALAVGAMAGLVFGFFPQLDLKISAWFFDPETRQFALLNQVRLGLLAWPAHVRDASMWLVAVLAIPAGVALAAKCVLPTTRMRVPGRAIVFLLATLALGPGVLVNVALKEHWGRARPIDVREFNGAHRFVAQLPVRPRPVVLHQEDLVLGNGMRDACLELATQREGRIEL